MAWRCYQLTYELQSPLHIGYHKVGNVQRTRYYLPARNLWAAVTEALTRGGFGESVLGVNGVKGYETVGKWVQEHCAFTYFYILEGDRLLTPRYVNGKLCYGDLPEPDFERRYLDSMASTALEPQQTAAKSGSLHEVEFISPYPLDGGAAWERTRLRGYVFLDEQAQSFLGSEENWEKWLGHLRVGGERRYGFGRLRLARAGWWADAHLPEGCTTVCHNRRPGIRVPEGKALLAHALAKSVNARGEIEPLVGRETLGPDSSAFGRALTQAQVCWSPGAVVAQETEFVLQASGLWDGQPVGR